MDKSIRRLVAFVLVLLMVAAQIPMTFVRAEAATIMTATEFADKCV